MTVQKAPDPKPAQATEPTGVGRRTLFAGAGAVGALAVAATALTGRQAAAPQPAAKTAEADAGGYQLTEHVKRYYATARV